jgi:HTH-type transcriptional regulator/antitoxin HigA
MKHNWNILNNDTDYEEALKRLDEIFDAEADSREDKEADLLVLLIEKYEEENYPIPDPDPVEAIKLIMEQKSLRQKDLIGIIGDKTTVSKVLKRKRKLTLEMIRKLNASFKIPVDALISDYQLAAE